MAEPSREEAQEATTGVTENQVNMEKTVPQRIDPRGARKVEDAAGTGTHDSQGG